MFGKMDLRSRLTTLGIMGTVIPLIVVILVVVTQDGNIIKLAKNQSRDLIISELDNVLDCTAEMVAIQQVTLSDNLVKSKDTAETLLKRLGGVTLSAEPVAWQAVNQFTKSQNEVALPRLLLGGAWPGQVREFGGEVLLVDEIQRMTGANATVFQRMNAEGAMLRVCTNVKTQDGKRAIGTYIPVVNPDGAPNPVLAEVLRGREYVGRAFVVDAWYNAAYQPIRDDGGQVIGMLYVGVKQSSQDNLSRHLREIRLGQSGYVFVLNATGNDRGKYVISKDGARDGENIWEAKDADGKLFIQELCRQALELGPKDIGEIQYQWLNPGELKPRMKTTHFVYFKPWDWVIGCGLYEDEMNAIIGRVTSVANRSLAIMLAVTALAIMIAVLVWYQLAKTLTGKVIRVSDNLTRGANQITSASGQISEASQALAEGASEQASALEEISSSLEEMTSVTRQNADNANSANEVARQAHGAAEKGSQAMSRMGEAIRQIKSSSDQTAKILKTIDEIAFQTNLLALNAAVEAARAGEAGKSFAVVAEEVRNLAMRSAEAAKNTAALIEDSQRNSENGVSVSEEVDQILSQIVSGARNVTTLVEGVATASHEQARGIDQIAKNVAQMDKVTQSNASTAEESASSSEELSAQAREMREIVNQLVAVVGHGQAGKDGSSGDSAQPQDGGNAVQGGVLQRTRAAFHGRFQGRAAGKPAAAEKPRPARPQDVIPMDDKELSEF